MNKAEITARLSAFPYSSREYWVITGAAMVLYGIREETADIDLGCTTEMADRLETGGYLYKVMPDGTRWFKISAEMEAFENWLCDSVIMKDGIPVISLKGLREMKEKLGREKDLRDIQLIDDYRRERGVQETWITG